MVKIIFFASVMHSAYYMESSDYDRIQPSDLSCIMSVHQQCPDYGMCIGVGIKYKAKMTISGDEKLVSINGIVGHIGPTLLKYGKDWHRIAWNVPIISYGNIFIRTYGSTKSGYLFDDHNHQINFDCSAHITP